MKQEILKLNKHFYPLDTAPWQSVIADIMTGVAFPLDIDYEMSPDGIINKNVINRLLVVRTFEEWENLPIREYDEYITTVNRRYRLPAIVVSARFDKIIQKKVIFPTKSNIWERDNYTCQYTGKKLSKDDLSIDHILPVSRGGQNSWENLVCCDKTLNNWKADRTPEECKLKLRKHPTKPLHGKVFSFLREEWEMFVTGGTYE